MLALTPHMRIYAALQPIDFRAGMNRLSQIVENLYQEDPMSGIVFAFINKARTDIKILVYDGSGFFLIHN
jgi:transposase